MQVLGLAGMAAAWRELAEQSSANELSRDEWLGLMLDREVAMRADKRVRNRLASAKLRFPEACIEDIDFAAPRGLDRRNTMALAQGEWLKAHENLIVTGQTGTGKSWLACAFSEIAVRELAEPLSGFCEMRNPNKNGHGQQAAAGATGSGGRIYPDVFASEAGRESPILLLGNDQDASCECRSVLGRPTSGLARAARASRAKGEREAYLI
ncbi:ATP-binding protein [Mesorhizobium sp.]|uniref:ATP-binding protein n=1 Tax=Mesorhizobium sp. TaxID=1871066 RepID=UPI0025B9CC3A|nr:ATP-binding protein [Mesorhizobium sp.]